MFSQLRDTLYPENKKIITDEFLESLEALGVAIWFLDDGTNLNKGTVLRFSTCCFSEKEHDMLQRMFLNKFGIHTAVSIYSGYRVLRILPDSRVDFLNLIKIHVPNCMRYKIDDRKLRATLGS